MKSFLQLFAVVFLLLSCSLALAQDKKPKLVPVERIPVKAEVVGVLEDNNSLAVIKVLEVDTANTIGLKSEEEILVHFYFSTKPVKNDSKLTGVQGQDIIHARISGKFNPNTSQYDYRIFEYQVVSKLMEIDAEYQGETSK